MIFHFAQKRFGSKNEKGIDHAFSKVFLMNETVVWHNIKMIQDAVKSLKNTFKKYSKIFNNHTLFTMLHKHKIYITKINLDGIINQYIFEKLLYECKNNWINK